MSWVKAIINDMECYSIKSHKYTYFEATQEEVVDKLNLSTDNRGRRIIDEPYVEYNIKCNFSNTSTDKLIMYKEEPLPYEELPSGTYKLTEIARLKYLVKVELKEKEKIVPIHNLEIIKKELESFKNAASLYKELHINYRRGVLLYGPPGTGKSTSLHSIFMNEIDKDSIVLMLNEPLQDDMLYCFKKDRRLKIIIFEELTTLMKYYQNTMLNFLDGEDSLSGCFTIATTNHPELLSSNITKRPGRFDLLIKIGYLQITDIEKYLKAILNHVPDISCLHKNVTIAELKEIILRMKRDKLSFAESAKNIYRQIKIAESDFNSGSGIGFTRTDESD